KFLAHFHSHPGKGPGATHPSGTDENFQGRLERAGHLRHRFRSPRAYPCGWKKRFPFMAHAISRSAASVTIRPALRRAHLAVMAIFSRDGYVRFVRLDRNFEIEIYGEGVEAYAPGIYRLKNFD